MRKLIVIILLIAFCSVFVIYTPQEAMAGQEVRGYDDGVNWAGAILVGLAIGGVLYLILHGINQQENKQESDLEKKPSEDSNLTTDSKTYNLSLDLLKDDIQKNNIQSIPYVFTVKF